MLKALAYGWFLKASAFVFSGILLFLLSSHPLYAKGQGPVGVWPASARYALVADTSLPGLVLVDLETGTATERLVLDKVRPVGVASCPNCDFVLITGGKTESGRLENFWLLHLQGTVAAMLQNKGNLGLDNARLEPLDIRTTEGKLTDGRICLVSDDGKTAFVAASQDGVLARVDFSNTPNAVALVKDRKAQPFGVNWDRNGALLVSMHKREVWRMTVDGKVLAIYDTKTAGCPGTSELRPNLRAAIDDPLNEGSLLILASNPISYDAVVWRLSVDAQGQQTCIGVAGKIGRDPGWIDASGESIEFSRPHYFSPRPERQPPQLIITDIDNRALRLLDLTTYATTTVMYNRDLVVSGLPPQERFSQASCAELEWPTTAAASGPRGRQFCIGAPQAGASELTLAQAKVHCSVAGARLCEPAELLTVGLEPGAKAWTGAECASCWQRRAGERCASTLEDYKTPGIVHSHLDFSQSWHSGQALAVGASKSGPAAALCRPVADNLKASAPCCADAAPVTGKEGA